MTEKEQTAREAELARREAALAAREAQLEQEQAKLEAAFHRLGITARAKALGQENYSTNRVSVGFIYQLPMF